MQVTDEMVERALSAYVQHPAKGDAMDAMKAALTAALAVDGLCLVPCEPTAKMIAEGQDLYCASARDNCVTVYRAMIAVANDGEERK